MLAKSGRCGNLRLHTHQEFLRSPGGIVELNSSMRNILPTLGAALIVSAKEGEDGDCRQHTLVDDSDSAYCGLTILAYLQQGWIPWSAFTSHGPTNC